MRKRYTIELKTSLTGYDSDNIDELETLKDSLKKSIFYTFHDSLILPGFRIENLIINGAEEKYEDEIEEDEQ